MRQRRERQAEDRGNIAPVFGGQAPTQSACSIPAARGDRIKKVIAEKCIRA
jgi:hypothetical protein